MVSPGLIFFGVGSLREEKKRTMKRSMTAARRMRIGAKVTL